MNRVKLHLSPELPSDATSLSQRPAQGSRALRPSPRGRFEIATLIALALSLPVAAQAPPQTSSQKLGSLPAGVRAVSGDEVMEVTALRDDVLRVRVWKSGHEPENASWAVLPEALHSTVAVAPTSAGFTTHKLQVHLGANLSLAVSDTAGRVLQTDAEPITRRPGGFRTYKQLTAEDHFFGLGD